MFFWIKTLADDQNSQAVCVLDIGSLTNYSYIRESLEYSAWPTEILLLKALVSPCLTNDLLTAQAAATQRLLIPLMRGQGLYQQSSFFFSLLEESCLLRSQS